MPLPLFCLVFCAAALHTGWDALVKIKPDPFLAIALISIACTTIAIPAYVVLGLHEKNAWPWAVTSIILHFGYDAFRSLAYGRAVMNQLYPITRGRALTPGSHSYGLGSTFSASLYCDRSR